MRPNFFHSASSSSISWQQQQQQQRNNGILAPFPYNQQQHQGTSEVEGTSFHRPHHLEVMKNMESPSSHEGDEIGDDHVRVRDGQQQEMMMMPLEKEHMFDKVVTPSDVGKLNRLVIPKQHAEKYFPLDSSANEKGLLLNFEDRNGKPWRFRYSYWNSSQSYVMTKGWSRFVKDKKLDAGDIVSFSRGLGELGKDHLFIDWRRRPTAPPPSLPLIPTPAPSGSGHHQYYSYHPLNHHHHHHHPSYYLQQQRCRDHYPSQLQHHQINYNATINPHHHHQHQSSSYGYGGGLMNGNPLIYFRSPIPQQQMVPTAPANSGVGISMMQMQRGIAAGGAAIAIDDEEHDPMVFESVPVVQGKAAAKRLRLFGVNMDCPISDHSDNVVETEIILSSTAVVHHDHHPTTMAPNPSSRNNFYSSSSSSSSSMRAHPYVGGPGPVQQQQRKMFSDSKGKGSLSLDFDV